MRSDERLDSRVPLGDGLYFRNPQRVSDSVCGLSLIRVGWSNEALLLREACFPTLGMNNRIEDVHFQIGLGYRRLFDVVNFRGEVQTKSTWMTYKSSIEASSSLGIGFEGRGPPGT